MGEKHPRASSGLLSLTAWGLTQPEEGQAESMSVSIETIAALDCTGTWGLTTSLLPAPGSGVVVRAPATDKQVLSSHGKMWGSQFMWVLRHCAKGGGGAQLQRAQGMRCRGNRQVPLVSLLGSLTWVLPHPTLIFRVHTDWCIQLPGLPPAQSTGVSAAQGCAQAHPQFISPLWTSLLFSHKRGQFQRAACSHHGCWGSTKLRESF